MPRAELRLWKKSGLGSECADIAVPPEQEQLLETGPGNHSRAQTVPELGAPGVPHLPGVTPALRQQSTAGSAPPGSGISPAGTSDPHLAQVFLLLDKPFPLLDQLFPLIDQLFPLLAQVFLLLYSIS